MTRTKHYEWLQAKIRSSPPRDTAPPLRFPTPQDGRRRAARRRELPSAAAQRFLDSGWKPSCTASGPQLHGSLGSTGLRPMPPHYSRDLEHGPGAGSGLLPRLPPPTCSRAVSGVGLGLLLCGFFTLFTAVSRPQLQTVFRSAICDCLSVKGCFSQEAPGRGFVAVWFVFSPPPEFCEPIWFGSVVWYPVCTSSPGPCSPTVFRSAICDCLSINGCFSRSSIHPLSLPVCLSLSQPSASSALGEGSATASQPSIFYKSTSITVIGTMNALGTSCALRGIASCQDA